MTIPLPALEPLRLGSLALEIFDIGRESVLEFHTRPLAVRNRTFNDLAGEDSGGVPRGGDVHMPRLSGDQGVRVLGTGNYGAELAPVIEAERLAGILATRDSLE